MRNVSNSSTISKYIGTKWYAVTVVSGGSQPEYLECLCRCGKRFETSLDKFKNGTVMSCGCNKVIPMDEELAFNKLRRAASRLVGRHGAGKSKADVCADWRESKVLFANWALNNGYKPGLTLRLIDKEKDYGPDNCWWAYKVEKEPEQSGIYGVFDKAIPDHSEESPRSIHVQIGKSEEPTAFRGFKDKGYALPDPWDEIPVRDLTESEISKYFLEV